MNNIAPERRLTERLVASCDAEVIAGLAILDTDVDETQDELVFFGQTTDLSQSGIGIILPSASIDERFCTEANRLTVLLHLPQGSCRLQVAPARCVAFIDDNLTRGYLLAGKIVSSDDEYEEYLKTLTVE